MGNELNITDGIRFYFFGCYVVYVYTTLEAKLLFGVDCASYTVLYGIISIGNGDFIHEGKFKLLDCSANDFGVRASKACYESAIKMYKKCIMSSGNEFIINELKWGDEPCSSWGMKFYLDNDFYVVFDIFSPKDLVVSKATLYKQPKREILCSIDSEDCFGIGYDTYKPWCAGDTNMLRKVVARLCRNYHQGITEECW